MRQKFILLLLLFVAAHLSAQNSALHPSLSVFLDCSTGGNCFQDYVRQELDALTFMRDRTDADVHIQNTIQYNFNGGALNTLIFIGRNHFTGQTDTISFYADPNNTENDNRLLLVKNIKVGIMPFLKQTELIKNTEINLPKGNNQKKKTEEKDPWNYWVFQLGVNGFASGNKNYFNASGSGYFTITRETVKNRTFIFSNISIEQQSYKDNNETYKYQFQNYAGEANHNFKITEHWGAGVSAYFLNSLFSNYITQLSVRPSIEYSIFPYKDFNTRRLIAGWQLGPQFQNYYDTTIYLKEKELLLRQDLYCIASFTKPWGSINAGVFWSNFFHDLSKNQLSINGAISTRIVKGLNFAVWGNYSFVHDQINIRKGDISLDQLLVKNRELLSSYNFNIGMGVSYRFGSKNNNQVFPAFKGLNYSINL